DLLVSERAVVANGRGVDEYLGLSRFGARLAAQGLPDMLGGLHPAVAQQPLEVLVPAAAKDGFAGKVDGGITVGSGIHPAALLHGIAFHDLANPAELLPR